MELILLIVPKAVSTTVLTVSMATFMTVVMASAVSWASCTMT
jgi:hypothetical protein